MSRFSSCFLCVISWVWTAVAATTELRFETGTLTCRLVNEGNAIWRVQSAGIDGVFDETGAVQALARWIGETMPGTRAELSVTDENGAMVATAPDGTRAELRRNPFTLAFFTADGACVQRLTRLVIAEKGTTVEGPLAADEHVLGLGERLDALDKRGSRNVLCTSDGYNNSSRTYLTVPFFFTSTGGGVFANGFESAVADFGKTVANTWRFEQERRTLDLYVFAVKTPAEAIRRYVDLAGHPTMPEKWSEGPVVCRYSPDLSVLEGVTSRKVRDRRCVGYGVKDVLAKYRADGVNPTAFICEPWGNDIFGDSSAFHADKAAKTKAAADYLDGEGIRMMIWMACGHPLSMKAPGFKPEFLVHADIERDGTIAERNVERVPEVWMGDKENPDVGNRGKGRFILDITNPEAWQWYLDVVWGEWLRCGVVGAKIDFCEEFPDDGRLYGKTRIHYRWHNPEVFKGASVHHAYPTFFVAKLQRELAKRSRHGFSVLARGGGLGLQRCPWMWAGDQHRVFEKLDDQVFAMLNSGVSGVPFMTYDAAGYQYSGLVFEPCGVYNPKTDVTDVSRTELRTGEEPVFRRASKNTSFEEEARIFLRGLEYTAWSGCLQTHGFVRHPYEFDAATRKTHKRYADLFAQLADYRRTLFDEACRTGLPPVRALALEFPKDATAWTVEDEYMFGSKYLVAPILKDVSARSVYLPEGTWKDLRSGDVRTVSAGGTRFNVVAEIDEIPVFECLKK